jgi:quercetin dioxygenase-like cupin family protein
MSPFDSFAAESRAAGFEEVLERKWPPNKELDTHTHPFSVRARVAQGEMWLTVGDSTQHLREGASFALDEGVPHAERYGAEGATLWVGRRTAAHS